MKSVLFGVLALCLALNTVNAKAYYYRVGREVIVPLAEDVKEVVAPVVIEGEEARAKSASIGRIENLEIIKPADNPLKSSTVAETVKNAAVEAVRTANAEVEAAAAQAIEPKPDVAAPVDEVKAEIADEIAPAPVVRQQNIIQQAQETISNLLTNNPIANAINSIRNPSTSSPVVAPVVADAEQSITAAIAPLAQADATTPRPGLLQSIQNTLNSLVPSALRPTPAPGAADEQVPIVQSSTNNAVSDNVDLP